MSRARWIDVGLFGAIVLLAVVHGCLLSIHAKQIHEMRTDQKLTGEVIFQQVGIIETLRTEVAALKKRLGKPIGAVGNATIPNEQLVQIYTDNQAAIDKLWLELGEETTLGEAVQAWLKQQNP